MPYRTSVLNSIARNTGAPPEVLLRILAPEAREVWDVIAGRPLPVEVIDAILAHPDPELRVHLTQNGDIPAEQRGRLVDDPDPTIRRRLAYGPEHLRRPAAPLPEDIQRRLLTDPNGFVRSTAKMSPLLAPHLWKELVEPTLPGPFPPDIENPNDYYRYPAIRSAVLDQEAAERILASTDERDRAALAWNVSVAKDLIGALATDDSPTVRLAYASRHDLTEDERAEVDYHVGPQDRVDTAPWLLESEDPEIIMAGAQSANLLLRRTVAGNKSLPPEGVELLSHDPDYIVRLLLCENQTGVDPEVVLQTYLACEFITKSDLLRHRDFPKPGLAARFAGDPDPARRWLSCIDPEADPDVLTSLLGDPEDHIRQSVAAHPNLPLDVLLACYGDEAFYISTLNNPSLPELLLHEALDEAGVPR